MKSKDPGHFILRKEDYDNTYNWISCHRHQFLCDVYDRVKYAIENDMEKVKLYDYTFKGKTLRRYNMVTEKILNGNFITKTMLKYFEREEHYDKCSNIVKWVSNN
jgi:hypothetical protein